MQYIFFSFLLFAFLIYPQKGISQRNQIVNKNIKTLQVVAGENWLAMPIIKLNDTNTIKISFDDLTHEYRRYAYRIEHCDANWNISEGLFTSDYIEGFNNGNVIEDVQESLNTNTLYTHYQIEIPNERCKIKMSGNYRVTIYDDNTQEKIAICHFMVYEPLMGISLSITANTDKEINGRMQQVTMMLNYGTIKITDPMAQLKTYILQNGRWHTAVKNLKPQIITNNGLQWIHNPNLIFWAGNEYRKFEAIDLNHATMGIERMHWDGSMYQAYLWHDEPRNNYIYDEDANGAFYIRNTNDLDNNRMADYVNVHFTLKTPQTQGNIYINGTWTNDQLTPTYQMTYNTEENAYTLHVLLKQGYYSYQYLLQHPDNSITFVPSEGSFYQTENTYQALVYYRAPGARTDRLVGYQEQQAE